MGTKISLKEKLQGSNDNSGLGELVFAKAIWDFSTDGGAVATITPKQNVFLPKNATIIVTNINVPTGCVSGGGGSMSFGTSAGSSATALLGATAVGALGANAVLNGTPVIATPVRLTAKGYITVTITNAVFTAGRVEIDLAYYVRKNS